MHQKSYLGSPEVEGTHKDQGTPQWSHPVPQSAAQTLKLVNEEVRHGTAQRSQPQVLKLLIQKCPREESKRPPCRSSSSTLLSPPEVLSDLLKSLYFPPLFHFPALNTLHFPNSSSDMNHPHVPFAAGSIPQLTFTCPSCT